MSDARVDVIRRLARRGAGPALKRALEKIRPEDVADAIRHLAPAEQRRVVAKIEDDEAAALVLAHLDDADLINIVKCFEFDRFVRLLEMMEVDDEADVIDRLPEDLRERVLAAVRAPDKELLEDILAWPDDSAGGIMQPIAFRLNEAVTCREAIAALHEQHKDLEIVFYLYVENDAEQLIGVTSLRALLTHSPSVPLRDVMTTDVITVSPDTDQEEVARVVSHYDLLAIPVVDENRRLLGIVTVDDVVDVIHEEAVEDMMLMAGVGDELEPQQVSVWRAARQRGTWLVVTLVGGIAMCEVVGLFGDSISRTAVLAGFIPVMLGTGGNIGIQAATVAVRNVGTGHTRGAGVVGQMFREVRVGALLGLGFALALGGYALARWWSQPLIGAAIAAAIALTAVTAATVGTLVPLTLDRLRIDPAIATGPFVTTGIDLLAIAIYFGTCAAILG